MIGVLLVEEERMLASALELAIGRQPDLDCVGTAATVDDALAMMTARRPDVVLMDIQLPGTDAIEGTSRIKAAFPEANILILCGGATSHRLAAAAEAGAAGFLAKAAFSDIFAAIRNPMPRKMLIERAALNELIKNLPSAPTPAGADEPGLPAQPPGPEKARLTAREQEVLALMGEGLDPTSIAERLVLSVYTVRGHVKSIMMKLGAHTQLEAVVVATREGLMPRSSGMNGKNG